MKKLLVLFIATILMVNVSSAQKIKVTSGDMKFMKDIAELSIVFEYADDMKLGKMTEQAYIDKKSTEAEAKEEGAGDKWAEQYYADRTEFYEPMFLELFEKYNGDLFVEQNNSDYKYTMIVRTVFTEPGYNVGISSKKASVDFEIRFIKTSEPSNILATISMKKAPGTAQYDQGHRVGESYAKGAKELAKLFKKKYL